MNKQYYAAIDLINIATHHAYYGEQNRQQLQIFCAEIMSLYERLQNLMPVELQANYQ